MRSLAPAEAARLVRLLNGTDPPPTTDQHHLGLVAVARRLKMHTRSILENPELMGKLPDDIRAFLDDVNELVDPILDEAAEPPTTRGRS